MDNSRFKFRAWDGKQMVYLPDFWWCEEYTSLCFHNTEELIPICGFADIWFELGDSDTPETLPKIMQFTGLKDCKGKEIYEADIVVINKLTGFVKYLGCSFMIEWIGADVYSDLLGWDDYKRGKISDGNDYQIIGNVHENPEFLTLNK